MISKILAGSFYLLFIFTPLFFTPLNNELFEYNKMMLVYGLTIIIITCWIIQMVRQKSLILKRTPLDLPILIFLTSQVLSTFFSIDKHTSLWGYYSRSNGGLFSILSYTLLFYALVSLFNKDQVLKFLKSAILGGLLVSLYAIPEHFGLSPSCIILNNELNADCWVQDVRSRVFATLGQPNWLAAYLAMLIFPIIYFLLQAKTKISQAFYLLILVIYYMAFTFTFSRGGIIGFLAGLGVFLLIWILSYPQTNQGSSNSSAFYLLKLIQRASASFKMIKTKQLLFVILLFVAINLLFGSALTSFRLIQQSAPPPRPTIGSSTQLENGGTESGKIRLIVWSGALDIFKAYPVLGSGVETFAYSYYNFRPVAHNMVSEWDFLYNKAHNEYLNYLATTGAVGFLSYLFLIGSFIFWSLKNLLSKKNSETKILILGLLGGYISYLIQNIFGFSVVMIAVFFFIFPAISFVLTDSISDAKLPKQLLFLSKLTNIIYKKDLFRKVFMGLIILISVLMLSRLHGFWVADTFYNQGLKYSDAGNPGKAYNILSDAVALNRGEPLYRNELGYAAASAALVLKETDATTSAELKDEALAQTYQSLQQSPRNVSLWRTAIRTFYELSLLDPSLEQKAVDVLDTTITLAPTDPKLYYNKGLVLSQMDRNDEARASLKKALELKPNYREALITLGQEYAKANETEKAREKFNKVLEMIPNDPDALKELEGLPADS